MRLSILLCALFIQLSADELSINEQIAALRDAPPEQRYELMNAIKTRISTMNSAQRAEAIGNLRRQRNTTSAITTSKAITEGIHTQIQQQHNTLHESIKDSMDKTQMHNTFFGPK